MCNQIVLKAQDDNGVFNPIKFAVIQFLDAARIGVDVSFFPKLFCRPARNLSRH